MCCSDNYVTWVSSYYIYASIVRFLTTQREGLGSFEISVVPRMGLKVFLLSFLKKDVLFCLCVVTI